MSVPTFRSEALDKRVTIPGVTAEGTFLAACGQFDMVMDRLARLRADHFNADPENITWGDVGSLNLTIEALRVALEHYGKGEGAGR
jgi:hypothetical protein